jgi:methyl-accepting chemotaxis protein
MGSKLGIWALLIGLTAVGEAIAFAAMVWVSGATFDPVVAVGAGAIGVSVAAGFATWLTGRWGRALGALTHGVKELGEGNLRFVVPHSPPSGLADVAGHLAAARSSLVQWVDQASGAAAGLGRAHEELSSSSDRTTRMARSISGLSGRVLGIVANQAELLREAISALMAFDELIRAAESNAMDAESIYRRTFETVGNGKEALDKLLDAMTDLRNAVHRSTDGVVELSREVLSIGDIVQTVHTIAKKTNLLAINAGIAAAQAGEKGQGFAIIAEEIRSLATQTSNALASIQDILLRVQGRTKEVASAIGVGTRKVTEGEQAAKDAGRAISDTREAMGRSTDQVGEILRATAHVKGSSDRLVEKLLTVANLAEETHKGARNVATQGEEQIRALGEVAGAVHALGNQAEEIERLLGRFRR